MSINQVLFVRVSKSVPNVEFRSLTSFVELCRPYRYTSLKLQLCKYFILKIYCSYSQPSYTNINHTIQIKEQVVSATNNFNLIKNDTLIMNLIIYSITFLDLGTLFEIFYKNEHSNITMKTCTSTFHTDCVKAFSVRSRISCSNIKQDLYIVSNRFINLIVSYATVCVMNFISSMGLCTC